MRKRYLWIPPLVVAVVFAATFWSSTHVIGRAIAMRMRAVFPQLTTVEGISVTFPLDIAFRNIQWPGRQPATEPILQVHRIVFQPSLGALVAGRLLLSRMTIREVELRVHRDKQRQWNLAVDSQPSLWSGLKERFLQQFLQAGTLLVHRLELHDGTVLMTDEAVSPPVMARLEHVHVLLRAMPAPHKPWRTSFTIQADMYMRPDGARGTMTAEGWLDPQERDLEAQFDMQGLELGPLHPYYQGQITRVRTYGGELGLSGTATVADHQLRATCQVKLTKLTESDISIFGRTIVDVGSALRGVQGALTSDVTITGPVATPARWSYQLAPNQAPLILLFTPFMEPSGEKTVINIGQTQLDVSEAIQRWFGPNVATPGVEETKAPAPAAASPGDATTVAETTKLVAPGAAVEPPATSGEMSPDRAGAQSLKSPAANAATDDEATAPVPESAPTP